MVTQSQDEATGEDSGKQRLRLSRTFLNKEVGGSRGQHLVFHTTG